MRAAVSAPPPERDPGRPGRHLEGGELPPRERFRETMDQIRCRRSQVVSHFTQTTTMNNHQGPYILTIPRSERVQLHQVRPGREITGSLPRRTTHRQETENAVAHS
jgi:hypothetical protein